MTRVVGIGAGGHAKVIVDMLRHRRGLRIVGLTAAQRSAAPAKIAGLPILGDDSVLPKLYAQGVRTAFLAVGGVGDNNARRTLFLKLQRMGFDVLSVIHPSAIVAKSARIGEGSVVMASCVIQPDAVVGRNVIVNTAAVIEHDCAIGDHAHLATGARLCGGVRVGEGAHIGAGATIKQGLTIGKNAVVGLGAAVVASVPAGVTVIGVPAKPR